MALMLLTFQSSVSAGGWDRRFHKSSFSINFNVGLGSDGPSRYERAYVERSYPLYEERRVIRKYYPRVRERVVVYTPRPDFYEEVIVCPRYERVRERVVVCPSPCWW
jgi:hypothetical protein